VQQLLEMLHDAGHSDFRDARGPMGFTQRQAGGKFTVDEATAFIQQLEAAADAGEHPAPAAPKQRLSAADRALQAVPDAQLASELQRRGWIVVEP
jgi:hypothetical protein